MFWYQNNVNDIILFVLQLVAMATLSLASKVQEHNTKLGDVVNTCHRY